MGSSDKASNKGHRATPHDGSAIELVGLCRSTLAWVIQMNKNGYYPYDSIETSIGSGGKMKLLLSEWLNKIDENFEKEFWIDQSNSSQYVNQKQIYKDTINSSLQWADFQLRPNFLIVAVVNKLNQFFWENMILKLLIQGKTFLMGYYIRAKLYWSKQRDDPLIVKQTIKHVRKCLTSHIQLLNSTDWRGLPEVTNANGHTCPYSCYVQAWSSATFIEAFYDLQRS
ncbi:unnamed protein product [Rotaria sp. Silwood1]|nr:unnamed protein product [Rotaria sp. Silwood1]CAF4928635.1 unnamed protein product [Rotaria sp. Silwood1]